jgi:hypothetical protein
MNHLAALRLYFNYKETTDEKDFENLRGLETKLVSNMMGLKKQALITDFFSN